MRIRFFFYRKIKRTCIFCAIRSGFVLFGIIETPFWVINRNNVWAGVFLCFSAMCAKTSFSNISGKSVRLREQANISIIPYVTQIKTFHYITSKTFRKVLDRLSCPESNMRSLRCHSFYRIQRVRAVVDTSGVPPEGWPA